MTGSPSRKSTDVEADLEPLGLEPGVERLADPGLVGLLLAVAEEDVILEPVIGPLDGLGVGGLAASVEDDRVILLQLDLEHRPLVRLVGDDFLLHVGVQVEDADHAAVAAGRAAEAFEEVAREHAVLRPVADISRIGPARRRDDDPARAGLQPVEIAVRKAGRDRRRRAPGREARRSLRHGSSRARPSTAWP